eukprot:1591610-Prymnesium_polylepis.2
MAPAPARRREVDVGCARCWLHKAGLANARRRALGTCSVAVRRRGRGAARQEARGRRGKRGAAGRRRTGRCRHLRLARPQRDDAVRVARQLGRQRHALPRRARVARVQQDRGLADDPPLSILPRERRR